MLKSSIACQTSRDFYEIEQQFFSFMYAMEYDNMSRISSEITFITNHIFNLD